MEFLVANGHPPGEVAGYTIRQLELFVEAAVKRRNRELVDSAKVQASATATGFTGNEKPLEALERSLTGKSQGGGVVGELRRRVGGLIKAGAVKVKER